MSISSTPWSSSSAADTWGELVAGQVKLQASIEAALDRADACECRREFELALAWLDQASALGGGLSRAGLAQRARCARALEGGER